MKKAKIMLSVVAVLAIAGAALAFKARTTNGLFICTTTTQAAGICGNVSTEAVDAVLDPVVNGGAATFSYTIIDDQETCGDESCLTAANKFVDGQ